MFLIHDSLNFSFKQLQLYAGVQNMGILGIKYIGQIVFRRTVWAWETRVICPIVRLLGNYLCKCSDSAVSNSPMVGQCCVQLSKCWTMLCQTVQWLDSVVSNSPMVGQCCVQPSDGCRAGCPTVQWSECAFVQLSNGRTVLCPTVRRSDNALSNCPMVGQCCVQQSNG